LKTLIKDILINTLEVLKFPEEKIILENPKVVEHGDISTNIALLLTKKLNKNPREIALSIVNHINSLNDPVFSSISIAGPGFINFKLSENFYHKNLLEIINNANYGKIKPNNKSALVEFVSANPTGPLTVGHGRGAVLGDTISNILEWNGYNVNREYYFNNAGRQMRKLGESVYSRYSQLYNDNTAFPEDGYKGDYIKEISKIIAKEYNENLLKSNDLSIFKDCAEKYVFKDIKSSLKKININFDSFFNEDDLYKNGDIDKVISDLEKQNIIYQKDGATWFNAKIINREQDKVLIKSSGEPTYRLPDVAYHKNKFERNFDIVVDVFGADHTDTYPDVIALINKLNCDIDKMRVIIHQFVTITENGETVKMSTRKANFITLEELCDEVGPDVLRYFFIMRGANTHLNFDIGIAKKQSDDNPVFYLQYAYARISNILNKANDLGYQIDKKVDLGILNSDIEKNILRKLYQFLELIVKLKNTLEPQILANYLQSLSSLFHKFYVQNKVITDNAKLTSARLILISGIKNVLKNGLNILGVNAPEKM
tara:strand:+ start:1286 stop:2911 length:1626 start_codon:yes stop_codon:yes gene_type:complete